MEYFSVNELCVSGSHPKLVQVPKQGTSEYKNIVTLIEKLLDPVREKLGKPIRVTSGYRPPALNKAVGGSQTSNHCFDKNTEILTDNGWKTAETITDKDRAYTYNVEKDIIELCDIEDVISYDYDGDLYCACNNHVDFAVTNEHRMLVRNEKHVYKRTTDKILSEKEQKYFDSLKTENYKYHFELAKDVFKKRRFFKCAGFVDNKNTYDVNVLKLCFAVIAGGYIIKHKGKFKGVGFNLKKERKMALLEQLLNDNNYKFTKRYSKGHEERGCSGVYIYYLNQTTSKEILEIIGMDKKIPKWVLSLSPNILEQLVLTYAEFDGTIDKRDNNSGITLFSNDEENIDKMQLMSVFSNMRCVKKSIKYYDNGGYKTKSEYHYHLYITTNKNESKMQETLYEKNHYKGLVWCIRTKNGTVVIRRNGKISFQGNCTGSAADIHTGNDSTDNILIVKALLELKIPYDECIIEGAKFNTNGEIVSAQWVHVAYRSTGNRMKLLWTKDFKTYNKVKVENKIIVKK